MGEAFVEVNRKCYMEHCLVRRWGTIGELSRSSFSGTGWEPIQNIRLGGITKGSVAPKFCICSLWVSSVEKASTNCELLADRTFR